ncbi:AprI/Inh family metalloprotease inhibitor [Microbaculum marinum]|uniref:AprI/Inh family metalloprotease inhibitor n=1 Tax=Microbaculum marinum TaxID=1764581 RepID=A0AAW9RXB9_9HYPH
MRMGIALVFMLGLTAGAAAEPNEDLMDLTQGLWSLAGEGEQGCDITLGDRPAKEGARVIDDAGDCRNVIPGMSSATAWRIEEPGTLVFLSDTGKVLLKLQHDQAQGEFRADDQGQTLVMSPLD